jgi:hypothetical protein
MIAMDVAAVYTELYARIPPLCHLAVEGLDPEALARQAAAGTNPIGWLVWHLTRVQDHHVSEVMDVGQLYVDEGWWVRFGRDPEPDDVGFGATADEVAEFDPIGERLLLEYLDAVHTRTVAYLASLSAADLDRIVDRNWDPPVTLGVRLVSVADDALQHAGQALYVRGMLDDDWRFPA